MKYGDRGVAVKVLQAAMKKRSLALGVRVELAADGAFGPQTATALAVLFQAEKKARLRAEAGLPDTDLAEPPPSGHWFAIAQAELGQEEIRGAEDNPRIVEYQKATTLAATDDETPWCSSFVCWTLEQAGIESTKSARARSYESWGQFLPLERLTPGAVVVFWRGKNKNEGKGHVGFYVAGDPSSGKIAVLGGNQGDSVSISTYKTDRILGFRWPADRDWPAEEAGASARQMDPGEAAQERWA